MIVPSNQVKEAVEALKVFARQKPSSIDILEDKQQLILQLIFKQIPKITSKLVKIHLPVSIKTESTDVCLFVKDIDPKAKDSDICIEYYKELLAKHKISQISEIIPLKVLKNEYKPFEAKRKLSNSYGIFLADERIIRLLPSLLGKHFYGRGRFPVQVNLMSSNLAQQVNAALHTVVCNMSTKGASFQVIVGHTEMSAIQAIDNVTTALTQIMKTLPGGANNVRSVYLKTEDSPALPLYVSEDYTIRQAPTTVKHGLLSEQPEEVATVTGAKVLVTATGRVKIIRDDKEVSKSKVKKSRGDKAASNSSAQRKKGRKTAARTDTPKTKRTKKSATSFKSDRNTNNDNDVDNVSHAKRRKIIASDNDNGLKHNNKTKGANNITPIRKRKRSI